MYLVVENVTSISNKCRAPERLNYALIFPFIKNSTK